METPGKVTGGDRRSKRKRKEKERKNSVYVRTKTRGIIKRRGRGSKERESRKVYYLPITRPIT